MGANTKDVADAFRDHPEFQSHTILGIDVHWLDTVDALVRMTSQEFREILPDLSTQYLEKALQYLKHPEKFHVPLIEDDRRTCHRLAAMHSRDANLRGKMFDRGEYFQQQLCQNPNLTIHEAHRLLHAPAISDNYLGHLLSGAPFDAGLLEEEIRNQRFDEYEVRALVNNPNLADDVLIMLARNGLDTYAAKNLLARPTPCWTPSKSCAATRAPRCANKPALPSALPKTRRP